MLLNQQTTREDTRGRAVQFAVKSPNGAKATARGEALGKHKTNENRCICRDGSEYEWCMHRKQHY
ncbi:MAG: hypothetical protein K9H26_17075 [Prolixibacteraceae bacterium]|nr:hypothetical protein [Prolixibacteraceae bacterium]